MWTYLYRVNISSSWTYLKDFLLTVHHIVRVLPSLILFRATAQALKHLDLVYRTVLHSACLRCGLRISVYTGTLLGTLLGSVRPTRSIAGNEGFSSCSPAALTLLFISGSCVQFSAVPALQVYVPVCYTVQANIIS